MSENAPHVHGAGTTVDRPRRRPVRVTRISRIRTSDDRISFDVDRPRSPVLVKASYFPNWRVSGAKGPWRVTPNLMVVVPTARHVSLHYGRTAADWLGNVLAVIGVAALFLLRRRGPVVYPDPGVGVAAEEQLALDFEGAFVSGDGHGPGGEPPGAEPDTEPVAVPDRA